MPESQSLPFQLDLGSLAWQVRGWRPFSWVYRQPMELATGTGADIQAVPMKVPGSVQAALLESVVIGDWNVGLASRDCEWVEHRHWEVFCDLPAFSSKSITLCAEGLDHSGWILVDGRRAAEFCGSLVRHRIDLSDALGDGKEHRLSIVFDTPPEEQGQIGFTSRTRHFKPRYNFSWDWCPRFVPIGVSDRIWLQIGEPGYEIKRLRTTLLPDNVTGRLLLDLECREPTTVAFEGRAETLPVGRHALDWEQPVSPWQPNGNGEAALYNLQIGEEAIPVGFKRVRWLPCEGAPADAEPWVCEINGEPTFLQGVNWTPLRVDYHGVTQQDYEAMVERYRAMGCNVLRVWGGAFLEREAFYRACDRAGILVWQEFPLSSSGPDNNAPTDPAVIEHLCAIASDYIARRGHHACKLLWCGGNELQTAPGGGDGTGLPLDIGHPCLKALGEVVEREDPGTRFLPTSASGPNFKAKAENFGKGVHHDVHGPWNVEGDWEAYWDRDDALFRSEVGMPGASDFELIERYRGACSALPVSSQNPYWQHLSAWWIQTDLAQGRTMQEYVAQSQALQAKVLATAARVCKSRFPRCGGFLVWMGHDCYPVPVNTSVIDFEENPKPAYHALAEVFLGRKGP
jgi:beta-mannosidase